MQYHIVDTDNEKSQTQPHIFSLPMVRINEENINKINFISLDMFIECLEGELDPELGLELVVHPVEAVHGLHRLAHDLFLRVIRALGKYI